jgi:uncharacterized protein (DUF1810 family)
VAQDSASTYEHALQELREGRKRTHWMWFVFPQLAGLGSSLTAREFAIGSLQEARDYARDSVLGARLRDCAAVLAAHADVSAGEVLGEVDAMKLRSSMTLFALAADDPAPFQAVLARYFEDAPDPRTLALLAGDADGAARRFSGHRGDAA